MKRKLVITGGVVLAITALLYKANELVFGETPFYRDFKKVRQGMTREDVEAILGLGTAVNQGSIPQIVVAVNPSDENASIERSRKAGTIPTVRDFPTRIKPVVEGELILIWKNKGILQTIYVAFKDGLVCGTYFDDKNCL